MSRAISLYHYTAVKANEEATHSSSVDVRARYPIPLVATELAELEFLDDLLGPSIYVLRSERSGELCRHFSIPDLVARRPKVRLNQYRSTWKSRTK